MSEYDPFDLPGEVAAGKVWLTLSVEMKPYAFATREDADAEARRRIDKSGEKFTAVVHAETVYRRQAVAVVVGIDAPKVGEGAP